MQFFDYIYISGYRAYRKYDSARSDPRFSAAVLVSVCILSLLSLVLGIMMRLVDTDAFFGFIFKIFALVLLVFLAGMYAIYYYYSEKRTQRILEKFEKKPIYIRALWGWIAGLTFIVPITLFALLLNHVI
jgi:uncharacterized membrane-anchored protein